MLEVGDTPLGLCQLLFFPGGLLFSVGGPTFRLGQVLLFADQLLLKLGRPALGLCRFVLLPNDLLFDLSDTPFDLGEVLLLPGHLLFSFQHPALRLGQVLLFFCQLLLKVGDTAFGLRQFLPFSRGRHLLLDFGNTALGLGEFLSLCRKVFSKLFGVFVNAGSQGCNLTLFSMELDDQFADPSFGSFQIAFSQLSLQLIDTLSRLLETIPRGAQLLRQLFFRMSPWRGILFSLSQLSDELRLIR